MNSIGLNLIMRMGCLCSKERLKINGKTYYVRDRLGEGGFSTVELIEDAESHELYALKRIRCHSTEDQRIAMTEVEAHRTVKHSGVLELLDYDLRGKSDPLEDTSSEVLIVLPYYPRGTLAQELSRRESRKMHFSEREVLRLFHAICTAVTAFHSAQPHPLTHRDLKPANVLLDDRYSPVIMDLGSVTKARIRITTVTEARRHEELAAERTSMPYRAPELFNIPSQIEIDERTDVWSLGCILFALCFFKSPYDIVYERNDSVALAIVSGKIDIPQDSPFSDGMHDLIRYILVLDHTQRPHLQEILQKVKDLEMKNEGCV
ncbi:unnamed protein product [Orchesella dallaii]|uniref:non-specific serine/threonine protein kinase n=1 Tax=Orchesella dallaii TaxID=48710 RepID=A0ABP1QQB1_9HEXA